MKVSTDKTGIEFEAKDYKKLSYASALVGSASIFMFNATLTPVENHSSMLFNLAILGVIMTLFGAFWGKLSQDRLPLMANIILGSLFVVILSIANPSQFFSYVMPVAVIASLFIAMITVAVKLGNKTSEGNSISAEGPFSDSDGDGGD